MGSVPLAVRKQGAGFRNVTRLLILSLVFTGVPLPPLIPIAHAQTVPPATTTAVLGNIPSASVPYTLGEYVQVASVRVTRTVFDYTYTAKLTNAGVAPAPELIARLTSSTPATQIIDGDLSFSNVPAGSTAAGRDTFTVRQDRSYAFDPAKLLWTVSINQPPVANAGPDRTLQPGATVQLDGSASSDPNGSPLKFAWTVQSVPSGAGITLKDPTTVRPSFVPTTPGVYVLRLVVNDGRFDSTPATVTITVASANRAPVARDDSYAMEPAKPFAVAAPGVLGNDNDADGSALAAALVKPPSHGSVTLNADGSFTYTPTPGTPVASLTPRLKWSWTSSPVLPDALNVAASPVVIDLDADGVPEVVFGSTASRGGSYVEAGVLRALRGDDGRELFTVTDPTLAINAFAQIAGGDLDGDGRPEIVVGDASGQRLLAFAHDGTPRWRSPQLETINWGGPSLADLDGDGVSEIVIGRQVLNADGSVRWTGTGGRGSLMSGPTPSGPLSIVADVDLDGVPEVIAGNTAYRPDGTIKWQVAMPDGFPGIGNFDDDPFVEIVVVVSGQVFLLEHDGVIKWGPVVLPGGGGGPPTVADLDGDGRPEIGVAGASRYTVIGATGAIRWSAVIQDGSSAVTGSSVFDFDGDGRAEVVYRDELRLRIYRGADGVVLFDSPLSSCTGYEYMPIVDIDGDGSAEIVASANDCGGFGSQRGILVYGDAGTGWTQTRSIWNQHSYHVTNVTEDGGVPKREAISWLVPGLNSFRLNAWGPSDVAFADSFTYRANDGSVNSNAATVFLNLRQTNHAPVFTSAAPLTATAGLAYSYQSGAIDPDGDRALTFSLPTAPAGMTIDAATGLVRWTPATAQGGAQAVTVRVRDAGGLFAEQSFAVAVTVPQTNRAPVITSTPVTTATAVQPYSYDVDAKDADGDSLSYSLVVAPTGMTIISGNGLVQWAPTEAQVGANAVTVRVTDGGGLAATQAFSVLVAALNHPPTIAFAGIAPQWMQVAPIGTPPSPRAYGGASAYDAINDRLILFGGSQNDAVLPHLNEVWVLENATNTRGTPNWTTLNPTGGAPVGRNLHTAVYDPTANRLIVYGGCSGNCGPFLADAWVLTNANGLGGAPEWLQLPSGIARAGQGAAYDAISNRLIVFGGFNGGFMNRVDVLVDANGVGNPQWISLAPIGTAPPAREGESNVTYDPITNRLIVFGGRSSNTQLYNDVWVLSNANGTGGPGEWSQLLPVGDAPAPRYQHSAAFAANSNQLIVFGGMDTSVGDPFLFFDDSWVLKNANGTGGGAEWVKLRVGSSLPAARAWHSSGHAGSTNKLVVAAGRNERVVPIPSMFFNDTWVLANASGNCTAGQPCTFKATATDPDAGDALTYSLDAAPAGMTIDAATGAMTWTPATAQIGNHAMTVRVTDRGGLFATQTFTATVAAVAVPNVVGLAPEWAESFINAADLTVGTKTTQGGAITLNFDSLPSRQGWVFRQTYSVAPESTMFSINPGLLQQHTIGAGRSGQWYESPLVVEALRPFRIVVRARVLEQEFTDNYLAFAFGACLSNECQITGLGPNVTQDHSSGAAWVRDNTQFHEYVIDGAFGRGYRLSVDGAALAAVPSVPQPYPYPQPGYPFPNGRMAILGDYTNGPNARAEVTAYTFTQPRVVGQNPPAGTLVPNKTAVDLTIVDGPATQTVPNLTGFAPAQADAALIAAGLVTGATPSAPSSTIPAGQVSDQSPLPGIHVPLNTPVNIVLSTGPPAGNLPPTITSSPVLAATAGQAYAYPVAATDPNPGDTLTFTLPTLPAGMTINSSTGLVGWTPTNVQVGNQTVTVRVTDSGGLFVEQSFTITVAPRPNRAPTITSTPITAATATRPYSYDVDATDADGDAITYSLVTAPIGMTIDAASGVIQWTPTTTQIGDHDVIARAGDLAGNVSDQSYRLSVAAGTSPNRPPLVISDPAVPRWEALVSLGPLPQMRKGAASTYTDERDRLVLFGGVDATESVHLRDVWVAEHASGASGQPSWSMLKLQPDGNPEARVAGTVVYDWLTDTVVAHGGCPEGCDQEFRDAWILTTPNASGGDAIWHQLASAPTARANHVAGFHPQSSRMVVYGNTGQRGADIVFDPPRDFSAGAFESPFVPGVVSDPVSVIAVDLDRDNHLDLVTTNINSNTVSVLLGRQGGTFGNQKTFSTDVEPMQVRAADFNLDGLLDVVTANSQNDSLSVLLGKGDGGFLPRIDIGPVGGDPESLAIADFNVDGIPDIATREDDFGGPLFILLGKGDGQFHPPVTVPITANVIAEVASADLNSDGKPDIIASTDSGISVFIGRGDGTFHSQSDYSITDCSSYYPSSSIAIGDLDLDGIPDVAITRPCDAIFVLLGKGNGDFGPARKIAISGMPFAIVISDMNSDGLPDLVSRYFTGVSLFLGDGSGSFGGEQRFATGTPWAARGYPFDASNPLVVADLNDDSANDVITTNHDAATVSVLLQRPTESGLGILDLRNGPDAAHWSELFPGGMRPPATWRVMSGAYDPQLNRLIVMGSATSDRQSFETVWILENATGVGQQPSWTKKATFGNAPTARAGHSVVYDHAGGRIVLFGGQDALGQGLADVWALTGFDDETAQLTWVQVLTSGVPPSPRASHIAAFSNSYGRMLILGGRNPAGGDSFANDLHALILKPLVVAPGESYVYPVRAEDPDPGDELLFSLESAPTEMHIGRESGLVQWTPAPEQVGDHAVIVKVEDQLGASSTHRFLLTVRSPNGQPVITSSPPADARSGEPYAYSVVAADPEGYALIFSLLAAPMGMSIDSGSGVIGWTPSAAQLGANSVTIRVTDQGGLFAEQTFTITVAAANWPPAFTTSPLATVTATQPYTYDADATDPDGGPLIYSLVATPTGMTIDSASGLIQWTPNAGQVGSHNVTVRVQDQGGLFDTQSFVIVVVVAPVQVAVPNVVGVNQLLAEEAIINAGLKVGTEGLQASETVPAGNVISQSPAGGSTVLSGSAVDLVVSSGPPAPGVASIQVLPATPTITTSSSQQFTAYAIYSNGSSQLVTGSAIWSSSDPAVAFVNATPGLIGSTAGGTGTATINASYGGKTGSATIVVVLRQTNGTAPTAEITSPTDQAEITGPVAVIGTATDPEFLKYIVEIAPVGDANYTPIAESTTAVANGTLGTLDPTLLINDLYSLRLRVFDRGGIVVTTAPIQVQIKRERKVGIFTLAFQDANIPYSCLPVSVTRVYDSRDKRVGDFGVGWRLDLQTMRLRETGTMGEGWQIDIINVPGPFGVLFPTYELYDTAAHKVALTLPDGHVEEFDLTPSPNRSRLPNPIGPLTLGYTPRPGTLGSLAAIVTTVFAPDRDTGSVVLIDSDVTVLNPQQYRYTSKDGTVFVIDKTAGVQQVQCTNGVALTVTPTGISHDAGRGALFTRDAQGRITSLTDPNGRTQTYTYDANGDLASHTDAAGNFTRYVYNRTHGLLEIQDPRGVTAIRNDYGADGRLVASTDPLGKTSTFNHDLVARKETITDRLGNVTVHEYDDAGNVLRSVDPMGGVTTRTYDGFGNELTRTDPLGRTTTLEYDSRRNVLKETDPLGRATSYTYNALSQVTKVTDALGRETTNTYDVNGNLTQAHDALGNTTSYVYDVGGVILRGSGNLLSKTDALGNITRYEYDAAGRMTKEADALGRVTTSAYDANGNRTTQATTRTVGGVLQTLTTTFEYDANNRLTRTTHPDGTVTRTEYNAIGKQAKTIDALGRETRYDYDALGRLATTTYPDGSSESSAYDAEGRRVASTDRAGRTTSSTYDALGRLVTTTFADGTSTGTTYDAAGQVTASTDARGNATTYTYDDAGRRTQVTDAAGAVTRFTYDTVGNQSQVTDANGNAVSFTYDAANRRTRTTYVDGMFDSVAYDALGRQVAKTDQAGLTTQYGYDALGRLTSVTDALGQITRYGYDEQGNQLTQTDALGRVTRFAYDTMGRRLSRTLPLGMTETMTYDAGGNLAAKTDFNGRTTTYSYDMLNRLVAKTPDATFGQPPVQFSYLVTGQRASMQDASGTTTYTYDSRDRLVTKATPQGTLSYTYDASGNVASIGSDHAGGAQMSYAYDVRNRLASVTDRHGTTTYRYDAAGNLAAFLYPNGVEHRYTYNALNRLTNVTGAKGATTLASYTYTLGPAGNRTSVTEASGRKAEYTYDVLYRLVGETISADPGGKNGAIGYVYDPVGNRLNRTSTHPDIAAQTFAYDANDRITTESYDANGNTLASGTQTFAWDFENKLVSANLGAVQFVYDGDGNRVAKTTGGVTTQFLVDDRNPTGYAQVLEEVSGGAVQKANTWGLKLINQTQASGVSYYGFDGHGSVRWLSDAAGNVTDTYTFDAFGNLVGQTGGTPNVHLYAGEQVGLEPHYQYLRARYHNTQEGRFLTIDPLDGFKSSPVTFHKYLYGADNPILYKDPSGLLFWTIETLMAAATIGKIYSLLWPTLARGVTTIHGMRAFWKPGFELRNTALGLMASGRLDSVTWESADRLLRMGNRLIQDGAEFIKQSSKLVDDIELGIGMKDLVNSIITRPRVRLIVQTDVTVSTLVARLRSSARFIDDEGRFVRMYVIGIDPVTKTHSFRDVLFRADNWANAIFEANGLLWSVLNRVLEGKDLEESGAPNGD